MIFSMGVQPLQYVIDRKQSFGEWAINNLHTLFTPYREPNYSLDSIIHFFMNRLGQSEKETVFMDTDRRDAIFTLEKAIFDKENQQNE